ncbi:hypothetical protein U1Q18_021131 [Sarracenia purpurea var. burkii]
MLAAVKAKGVLGSAVKKVPAEKRNYRGADCLDSSIVRKFFQHSIASVFVHMGNRISKFSAEILDFGRQQWNPLGNTPM